MNQEKPATVDRVTGKHHEVRLEIYDLHGNCHVTTEIGLITAIRHAAESAAAYIHPHADGFEKMKTCEQWQMIATEIERHVRRELGL